MAFRVNDRKSVIFKDGCRFPLTLAVSFHKVWLYGNERQWNIAFQGIEGKKRYISRTFNYPQAVQDVDLVSSWEQICRNLALHHLLCNGSSAVNGCHQNESKQLITSQSRSNPHYPSHHITSCKVNSYVFLRNQSIKIFNSKLSIITFPSVKKKGHPCCLSIKIQWPLGV